MALTEMTTEFAGRRWHLFRLALGASLLTVLTLGFYRFWMKTRLRRFYWSSVRPGGQPLEYLGEPLEKLLGFLIAVVMMAFYIGVVNLILMFLSFSLFQGNFFAYALSFIGVIPIIFFAQYRARRYVLARTRWRGIRFGVEQGAWGYAWRALVHWLLTILTLGILWPRMTFWLEKYRTDRTFFGQARFEQGGKWTMLLRSTKNIWIALGIGGLSALGFLMSPTVVPVLGMVLAGAWLIYGVVFYRVDSFRRLANEKSLGSIRLHSAPRPRRILRHYLFGYTLTGLAITTIVFPALVVAAVVEPGLLAAAETTATELQNLPVWLMALLGAAAYFSIFILWGVLRQVFVGLPNLRHYAETLSILNAHELATINQRARDDFAEAEGFADALDVGAAI